MMDCCPKPQDRMDPDRCINSCHFIRREWQTVKDVSGLVTFETTMNGAMKCPIRDIHPHQIEVVPVLHAATLSPNRSAI